MGQVLVHVLVSIINERVNTVHDRTCVDKMITPVDDMGYLFPVPIHYHVISAQALH